MHDEYWLVKDSVGVKIFPRCGSTSILRSYGYGQSYKRFMRCNWQVAVVRHPMDRLLSLYSMFVNPTKDWCMSTRGYPGVKCLNDLLMYIVNTPQKDLDIHARSMTTQLGGWVPPVVMTLEQFVASPPFGLPKITEHENKSKPRETPVVDSWLLDVWRMEYMDDFLLYNRTKRAPTSGANKALT